MAKCIFYGVPAYGHMNPTLPIITELCRNGDTVYYYSSQRFKEKIENTGAIFKEYQHFENLDMEKAGKNIGYLYYILAAFTKNAVRKLRNEAEEINADYIIHDAIAIWGKVLSHILDIPAISSIPTFVFVNGQNNMSKTLAFLHSIGPAGIRGIIKGNKIHKALEKEYGIEKSGFLENITNQEDLNLVYTSPLFQKDTERINMDKYRFIGPSFFEKPKSSLWQNKDGKPVIYISLGTIWKNALNLDVLKDLAEMLECRMIVTGVPGGITSNSDDIKFFEYVDQISILQICDVFVSHGGMNSINEALYYQVPVVVFPFQSEQIEVAERVEELGCGIRLKDFSAEMLSKAIRRIIEDNSFPMNCKTVSESLRNSGGYKKGYTAIKEFTGNRIADVH